eukprot:TRINITY_DN4640_c0_g1_i2.p1 TRINITY_DN4640_c0_g1~~TRINITY_DN4640_c0_g1_i2.p1  ORF type:complete len:1096 (-),score=200.23 TRINITY_DN4640_c0_g1_i2:837-4124(-)
MDKQGTHHAAPTEDIHSNAVQPMDQNKVREELEFLFKPHVDSFRYFIEEQLPTMIGDIPSVEFQPSISDSRLTWWIDQVEISPPTKGEDVANSKLMPNECRERGVTYGGTIIATICVQSNDEEPHRFQKKLGILPLMVRSAKCHLERLKPHELIRAREEELEQGGYFIVNGLEKVIRLLVLPRRHYIFCLDRAGYAGRGNFYSTKAVQMRCTKPDNTSKTMTFHYLTTGVCNLRIVLRKQEFFINGIILLKALKQTSDREIYEKLVDGDLNNTFITERATAFVKDGTRYGLYTPDQALQILGSRFRGILNYPIRLSDVECGTLLIQQNIFVHLSDFKDKFEAALLMMKRLYSFVSGKCCADNPDSPMNYEILMPGIFYGMVFKEKLHEWLLAIKPVIEREFRMQGEGKVFNDIANFRRLCDRTRLDVGSKMQYLLSTGNLVSSSGLDLMQSTGYSIIAEKINIFRYISHFRSVHRGQFFTEMRTSAVRKLLPEAWGFLCPVHTPDGAPCGLLNHLTHNCTIITRPTDSSAVYPILIRYGMIPLHPFIPDGHNLLDVIMDGKYIGRIKVTQAQSFSDKLRYAKVKGVEDIPQELEIALVLPSQGGQHPGLYLFTGQARMMRKVRHLATGLTELIGSFEQVYLNIACLQDDFKPGVTTHQELQVTNFLSMVASFTPFSDFNQSPRNMYQCQMGKQSMGVPFHSFPHRTDNKFYRLEIPQSPIVKTKYYNKYGMDNYPLGMNAVIAVISYTGYDMEDAMIVNKSAYERGFGHAYLYKSMPVDLEPASRGVKASERFCNITETGEKYISSLDEDGLPAVGSVLKYEDPVYCTYDEVKQTFTVKRHKDQDPAIVDQVRVIGTTSTTNGNRITRVNIKLRFNRRPIIGDKFSSRHGQKGVLSYLWPQCDMPFTESGMSPDVIINPNAFPSRMTIGMLVETMAGKAGALHGMYQDATPFRFNEQERAIDYFGSQLLKAGYNYYGNEPVYSGITGTEMKADIFFGVVYYQRLRHMVSDKYQVRSTGPINKVTHQPVKGRKVGGGIRFGEMERDSLLAHGVSFLLHDRLMNSSDYHKSAVCTSCGSILATTPVLGRGLKVSFST